MRHWAVGLAVVVLVGMGHDANTAILTADVAVHSPGGQYGPLEVDEFVFANSDRYYWYDVPTFAEEQDFLFWQVQQTGFPSITDGITTFEILMNGPVLMACTTRWGGGGNLSGDWENELTSREELEDDLWVEFATGLRHFRDAWPVGPAQFEYIVFRRDCVAGEEFTYRTEKGLLPRRLSSRRATARRASRESDGQARAPDGASCG